MFSFLRPAVSRCTDLLFSSVSAVTSRLARTAPQSLAAATASGRRSRATLGVVISLGLFTGAGHAALVSNQFPATAVGASSAAQTVTFSAATGGSGSYAPHTVSEGVLDSPEFRLVSVTCVSSTCTAQVVFSPIYPGLRRGAVEWIDQSTGVAYSQTFIYGMGNGSQVAYPFAQSAYYGTSGANSVAVDGAGNIYWADYSANVYKITAGTSTSTLIANLGSGFDPEQLAVDGAGNVYAASFSGAGFVVVLAPVNGSYISRGVSTTGGQLGGIAVDGTGSLYISSLASGRILKETPNGPGTYTESVFAVTPGLYPFHVALDAANTAYFNDPFNGMYKVAQSGAVVQLAPEGAAQPHGVAVDASGSVYYADTAVRKLIPGSSGYTSTQVSAASSNDLAVSPAGTLYLAAGQITALSTSVKPSFSFGSVSVGSQSSSQTLTLNNIGNQPLVFPPPGSGTNPSISTNFQLSNSSTCPQVSSSSASGSLAVAASCADYIFFAPTTGGTISGGLVATDNSLTTAITTQNFSLSGTGTYPQPIVTAVSPNSGTPAGGTSVVINGTNFSNVNAVTFGAVPASSFVINSSSQITAAAPAHTAGSVDIVVSNASNSSPANGADQFTYVLLTPSVVVNNSASISGSKATLTATLTGGAQAPNGTLTFQVGTGASYSASCVTGGSTSTCTYSYPASSLGAGTYIITASYSGDTSYRSATATGTLTVAPASYTAPTTSVGSTSATQTATLVFSSPATLNSVSSKAIQVVTQGATGLDFAYVTGGTGACVAGTIYPAGGSCTIQYSFTPQVPGLRLGAIQLVDGSNNVVASTLLSGTGTGPQGVIYPGVQTVPIATTTNYPGGYVFELATDASGSLYVGDPSNGKLYKYTFGGTTYTLANTFATAGSFTGQMAVDGAGNLYYMDYNAGQLFKAAYNAATKTYGSPTVVLTGAGNLALALDTAGNLYISPNGTQVVKETPNGSGGYTASSPLFTLGNTIIALTVDASGNLYVADANAVYKETYSSGSYMQTLIGSGYSNANGIVVDAADDVYVSTNSYSGISMFVPNGSSYTRSTIGSGIGAINGVAIDASGNLYASGTNAGVPSVFKISVNGGQTYSFPTPTAVGNVDTVDGTKSITVTNIGNAPLAVSSLGVASGNFTAGAAVPSTGSTTTSVAPAGTLLLPLRFTPLSVGTPDTGTLVVNDNTLNVAGTLQQDIVTGTGTQGSLSVAVNSIAATSGASAVVSAVITYGGVQPAGFVSFTVAGGSAVTGTCAAGAGSETCTATISTASLGLGANTIHASFSGDANYSAASSNGTLSVERSNFVAPSTAVNATSSVQTATLTFSSNVTLNSTLSTAISVVTQGATGLDFAYVAGGSGACVAGTSYTAGQICNVQFTFTPKAPGVRLGGILLKSNASTPAVVASTYLSGTGTGPEAVFTKGVASTFASGISSQNGIAVDAAGDVYFTVPDLGLLRKIPAGTTTPITVVSGLNEPSGIAIDGEGNVFYAQYFGDIVSKLIDGTGTPVTVANINNPEQIALDGQGNLYVASAGTNRVQEYLAGSYTASTAYGTGLNHTLGVALDSAGYVYISGYYSGNIVRVSPDGATQTNVATGLSTPGGIAVDPAGNVYTGFVGGTTAEMFAAGTFAPTVLNTSFNDSTFVALDGSGNLFVVSRGDGRIVKLTRTATAPLTFAGTAVGGSTAAQSVGLTNIGNSALAISGIWASSANFTLDATATTCSTSTALASAGSCNVGARFTPQTTGSPLTDALSITDNSLNLLAAVQTVPLSGTATQGSVAVVAANAIEAAGSPASLTATFAYSGIRPTGAVSFNIASGTPVVATCVAGAGSETCTAIYPTTGLAAGAIPFAAMIAPDANYAGNSGTATLTLVPTSFVAPATAVGSTAATQTATMFFSAQGTLGAINVLTQGNVNLDFTFASGGTCKVGQAYNVGDTCTVLYNFTPKAPGQRLGGITLVDGTGTVLSSTFLSGTGTGPVAVFPTASAKTTVASVAQPTGIAMDAAGNVYVTDYTAGNVLKISAVNGVIPANPNVQTLASGLPKACGVAVDGVGNVFALSTGNNSVVEVPFNGTSYGTPVAIVTGERAPCGAAVDAKGNVFFSNQGAGTVREILASAGGVPLHPTVLTVAGGFSNPQGEAVDANGNVFVVSAGSNRLYEVPFSSGSYGTSVSVAVGNTGFYGITMDGSGNLYLGPVGTTPILEVQAVNGTVPMTTPSVLSLGSGFGGPRAMAVDGSGNLFVADFDNHAITRLDLTDGPALAFPDTTLGTTSAAQSAPVLNNGNAPLSVAGLATTSLNFVVDPTSTTCSTGSPVTSGASCNVGATFTPAAGGALSASLNITDNNLNTPGTVQALSLTGNGIAAVPTVTVSNASVVYGSANASLSATVAYAGNTAPAGGFRFTVGSGASVTASCSGTTSPITCTASYPVATLGANTYSINGTLTADANVAGGSGSGTLTVTQATPALNVVSTSASFSSSNTTLSATMPYSGANAPGGAVTFQVGSGPVVTATCAGSSSPLTCSATYPLATAVLGANQINVSVAGDANYVAVSATGMLTLATATATITSADASITYGAATTTLTGSIAFSGATAPVGPFTFAVGSRGPVVAVCSGTTSPLTCTASYVTSNLVPNTYTIALAMAADTRFAATTGSSTLTVTPALPGVSVANSSIGYGTGTTVLSAALNFPGIVPSGSVTFTVDNSTAVVATCSGTVSPITCTATYPSAMLTPQSHSVKASVAADANYSASSGTGTLIVTAKTPVITVANQSITFGTAQSTLSMSFSYTGVAPTGAVTFTVDGGAPVTATCSGPSSPRTCTASYPTASLATTTHTITAATAADAIYPAASATGTLTVTPGAMVVNVSNQSIIFGTASTSLSATVSFPGSVPSGAVNFAVDNGAAVSGTCSGKTSPLTCTATYATATLSTQPHTIKVAVAADANYQAAVATGTLNVTSATPVITVANQSGSFGSASTSLSASLAFGGSVSPSSALNFSVDGGTAVPATCAGTASPLTCTMSYPTAALSAGAHTITVSSAADANYKAAAGTGTLSISVTAATISFNVAGHVYGDAAFTIAATSNATGAFTYSVVSGPATIAGSTVTITGAGTVVLQANQAADANFSAGSKQASFTVAPASLTVAANNATRVYGAANPGFTGAVTGAKYSDTFAESFTTTATTSSAVGTYPIVPVITGSDLADYTTTVTNGTLTVTQAPTAVNLTASAASLNPGANLTLTAALASTTTGTPTGSVTFFDNGAALSTVALTNGTAVFNTSTLGAGATHSITVSYAGDANFLASATALGTPITIGQLDFTFTATGSTAYTAVPGAVATYGFAISPDFTSYAGAVNFTVTGLPAGATYTFSPASLTATSGAQAVVLSVQTPKTLAKGNAAPGSPMERGLPMLALLLLPGLGSRRVRRKLGTRMLMLILLGAGLGSAGLLTGCGVNNGFQLQPGATYTLTVTATSGSLQHSQTVTLTVQ